MNIFDQILQAVNNGTHTPPGLYGGAPMPVDATEPVPPANVQLPATALGVQATALPAGPGSLNLPPAPPPKPPSTMDRIGSAIMGVISPERGSFWNEALTHGLTNARSAQQDIPAQLATAQLAAQHQQAQITLANAQAAEAQAKADATASPINTSGGAVLSGDGAHVLYAPPPPSTDRERLIDRISKMGDNNPMKAIITRILEGANSAGAIADKGVAASATAAAKAAAVAAHRAPSRGRAAPASDIPAGYH